MKQAGLASMVARGNKTKALLVILVMLYPLVVTFPVGAEKASDTTWSRSYSASRAHSVQQTRDGGFIVAGDSFGTWVMKANVAGEPQWEKEYIPTGYLIAFANSVEETRDKGYVVAGFALPAGEGDYNSWLLKLDHEGVVQWSRTFDTDDSLFLARQTFDGGYVAWGNIASIGPEVSNGWILKLDSEGNVIWQEAFKGQDVNYLDQTQDSGFIIAGTVGVLGKAEAWVIKLDPDGKTVWQKAYDIDGNSHANRIQQTRDGGFVVTGGSSHGILFLRLDRNGNIRWEKSYTGGASSSVRETSDGGFIVSGRSSGPWLLKLNDKGNIVWQKIYGGRSDFLPSVQQTGDEGFVAAGSLATNCCGDLSWVLKLDSTGSTAGCPLGISSNATITDAQSTVTNTAVTGVATNALVTQTGVAVSAASPNVQTLCIGSQDRDNGRERDETHHESRSMENEQSSID